MVRTILAGGHLTPMPRADGGGGGGAVGAVGVGGGALVALGGGGGGLLGALQPLQTAEQLMRSTEQAFVAQAVAEGNVVSVVASFRCRRGPPRGAPGRGPHAFPLPLACGNAGQQLPAWRTPAAASDAGLEEQEGGRVGSEWRPPAWRVSAAGVCGFGLH